MVTDLSKELKKYITVEKEADVVGFAPVERFDGAPKGHGPSDWLADAKSVISWGFKINDPVVDSTEYSPSMTPESRRKKAVERSLYYHMGHIVQDILNDLTSYKIARKLEREGFRAIPMPVYSQGLYGPEEAKIRGTHALFAHRFAAVRAGLGEFGLNNLVLNPKFGPRVRYSSVITNAELEYDDVVMEKICLGEKCAKCLQYCNAIEPNSEINSEKVWLLPPSTTRHENCAISRFENTPHYHPHSACGFYGMCLRSCPIGQNTKA